MTTLRDIVKVSQLAEEIAQMDVNVNEFEAKKAIILQELDIYRGIDEDLKSKATRKNQEYSIRDYISDNDLEILKSSEACFFCEKPTSKGIFKYNRKGQLVMRPQLKNKDILRGAVKLAKEDKKTVVIYGGAIAAIEISSFFDGITEPSTFSAFTLGTFYGLAKLVPYTERKVEGFQTYVSTVEKGVSELEHRIDSYL